LASGNIEIYDSHISTEAINTAQDIVNLNLDKDNGRMVVYSPHDIHMQNATITSSVLGGLSNGGDIDIAEMLLLQKSKIIANVYEGNGGNIHIVADQFIQSADSMVQASSKYGLDGEIFIDAPDTTIGNELVVLPTNYLEASQWL